MPDHVTSNSPSQRDSGSQSLVPPGMPFPSPQELLTAPLSPVTYRALLYSKSVPELHNDGTMTKKRLIALNGSLQEAYTHTDPVRRLITLVRAYGLRLSVPEYAQALSLRPHSLLRLEQKGFDPKSSVATSYSVFLKDWRARASQTSDTKRFFDWAESELTKLLLRSELTAPVGPILRWQLSMGAAEFAAHTNFSRTLLWTWRNAGKDLSFADLLHIGTQLALPTRAPIPSPEAWNTPWIKRARRSVFHHSLKIGRSPATTAVRSALEWIGVSPTQPELRVRFPGLTHEDIEKVVHFAPLPLRAWLTISQDPALTRSVPAEALATIDRAVNREARAPRKHPVSTRLAFKLMRNANLSTKHIAAVCGLHDEARPRWGTSIVREVICNGLVSTRLPWASVAALLSRTPDEFNTLLTARAAELDTTYRRRTGQSLKHASLFRKIWGTDPAPDSTDITDGLSTGSASEALTNLLRAAISSTPAETIQAAIRARGQTAILSKANSSRERLKAIADGSEVPSWPELRRFLRAASVSSSVAHEIAWRDAIATSATNGAPYDDLGNVQRRIVYTLVHEEHDSFSEFIKEHNAKPQSEGRYFRMLNQERSIHSSYMRHLLTLAGLSGSSARGGCINHVLLEKSYPDAIAAWYREGMPGVPDLTRLKVYRLLTSAQLMTAERLWQLPQEQHRLLALHHALTSDSKRATVSSDVLPLHEAVANVMRLFPGATSNDVADAFKKLRSPLAALRQKTQIPKTWHAQWIHPADRRLASLSLPHTTPQTKVRLSQEAQSAIRALTSSFDRTLSSSESILTALFPPPGKTPLGRPASVSPLLNKALTAVTPYVNLKPEDIGAIRKLLAALWSVAPDLQDSCYAVGHFLHNVNAAAAKQAPSTEEFHRVHDVLEGILSLLARYDQAAG